MPAEEEVVGDRRSEGARSFPFGIGRAVAREAPPVTGATLHSSHRFGDLFQATPQTHVTMHNTPYTIVGFVAWCRSSCANWDDIRPAF